MKKGYADTSLGQVHYRVAGEGQTLVLLHAATHSSGMFAELIPELADEYHVVAPDIPGFGNSDPLPAEASIPDLATVTVDVLDALGVERAHLFGLHTGNKIGAVLGAHHPDRLRKLVLCGLPHSIIPDEGRRDAVIADIVSDSLFEFTPTEGGAHLLKEWAALQQKVTDVWWDKSVLAGEELTRADIDRLAEKVIATIQYRGTLPKVYDANFEYDLTADLERIEPETLVVELTTPDELEQYGAQGSRVVDVVPDATGVQIDGDVDVFFEDPTLIAAPVLDFLAG